VNILVVSPHPDDEILGCGGTLQRLRDEGHSLYWVIFTEMTAEYSNQQKVARKVEIEKICSELGFMSKYELGFSASGLDQSAFSDLVSSFFAVIKEVEPEKVFCPYIFDVHSDHSNVVRAVQAATKSFRSPSIKSILMYETISETNFAFFEPEQFRPNLFVDISDYLDTKVGLAEVYQGEMGAHPFPRSDRAIRALATLRGSQCGVDAAEGFQIVYSFE
jgi:LmbE family N-acetylglucosaminyl deacetylase